MPILTVPGQITHLKNILLAYDGSIKAKEALFIAAYLGSQRQSSLKIITSAAGLDDPASVQKEAKAYLSRFPIKSEYLITQSPIPDEVSRLARNNEIDLILIGGYGGGSLFEVVLGSVVDQILREIQLPILICR